ncbi:carbon-nitrogen hydrolase family protein [Tunturibacter empetritectus]|uniref:Amidohydrolase n=1 Tax=Tunturiibacter lichenicola TaxID=2051959 RepID=A0A7W8N3J3_9BACT|nr:carbon-nitrogen hydrolase family protein [Edaphobacter lichenicola]MBB5343533.1 putative amidohydrolase [Edaphobacter lichenicola]
MFQPSSIRVAISQSAPVYHNKQASLTKALDLIQQASSAGAQLVVFGETWFPGYPVWLDVCPTAGLWNHKPTKRVFAELRQNSISVSGPEVKAIADAAGDLGIGIVIGINERVDAGRGQGTLYNSLLTLSPEGRLANHHPKLVPTFTERMVWGNGDGSGLASVQIANARVGGLICWEHWMPLARMAMHESGEQIHIAVWPTANEMAQLASRHYAFEGRCFVLAVGLMMPTSDLPSDLPHEVKDTWVERGGSAIIAPDASYIVEPIYDREELIVADLDLTWIDRESMALDVTGHYSRPDIFTFSHRALKD